MIENTPSNIFNLTQSGFNKEKEKESKIVSFYVKSKSGEYYLFSIKLEKELF